VLPPGRNPPPLAAHPLRARVGASPGSVLFGIVFRS